MNCAGASAVQALPVRDTLSEPLWLTWPDFLPLEAPVRAAVSASSSRPACSSGAAERSMLSRTAARVREISAEMVTLEALLALLAALSLGSPESGASMGTACNGWLGRRHSESCLRLPESGVQPSIKPSSTSSKEV